MSVGGTKRIRTRTALGLSGVLLLALACDDEGVEPDVPLDPITVQLVFPDLRAEATAFGAVTLPAIRETFQTDSFQVAFWDGSGQVFVPDPEDRVEITVGGGLELISAGNSFFVLRGVSAAQSSVQVSVVAPSRSRFEAAAFPMVVHALPTSVLLVAGNDTLTATGSAADGAFHLDTDDVLTLVVSLRDSTDQALAPLESERLAVEVVQGGGAVLLTSDGESWSIAGGLVGTDSIRVRLTAGELEVATFAPVPVEVVEAPCSGPTLDGICLREMASDFRFPTHLTSPPGDDRLMVARKIGVIDIIHPDQSTSRFVDMIDLVKQGDEQGLLGLAFHPDYASNGTFFVSYTSLDGNTQIDRMTVSSDPDLADLASREPVLTVTHDPEFGGHHNAGQIVFGPDGYLWITVGDGESPQTDLVATNTGDFRGSILRIRVTGAPLAAAYTVPLDNPFANGPATSRPEVYMYGLRNPWRISFDAGPDLLYISDVGENRREELNVVSRTAAGSNFGWNVLEGSYCRRTDCTAVLDTTVLPVLEYDHDVGAAIIGGYVYTGERAPTLSGRFVFADFEGFIRSVSVVGGVAGDVQEHFPLGSLFKDSDNPGWIHAFGVDRNGELYVLLFGGRIFRFEAATPTND